MFRSLVLAAGLSLAAAAVAQNAVPPTSSPAPTPAPAVKADPASVPADDMVILLVGACQAKPGEKVSPDCVSGVTKADFERMVQLVNLPEPQWRQFATRLSTLISASNEAKRRGLQNSPEGKEWQRIFEMQALASALQSDVRKQAAEVPENDVQTYYVEHAKEFREGVFEKVMIQKKPGTKDHPAAPEEDKAFATKIRERWIAGESPETLQKEASQRLDPKATPPSVHLPAAGGQPIRNLPLPDQDVFEMKPGAFSELKSNANGFYVYKVISSGTSKLEDKFRGDVTVHDYIKQLLQQQRMQKMMEGVQNSSIPKLNEKYFGPDQPAGFPGMQGGARPGGTAPLQLKPAVKPDVKAVPNPPAATPKGTQTPK